ncbi:HK97 gp10 family phage protein [Liberiplasma polymorphum]|uniref:HK97 gp10 family phage protein n=1 Tax=Liberiplasma polymorphum TaxID=3374570 RepID=UPI00377630BB
MATLDKLSNEIMDIINEYSNEVKKELESLLDKTATKVLDYVIKNAPRSGRRNAMADTFTTATLGEGINKTVVIYSKTKGRMIHFIEFGFKHRNGKFIPARAFMRPAFDRFTPEMLDEIKKIIERGTS